MATELVEEQGPRWEAAVAQVEAEEDQDRIHVGFMQDNTTGMIAGIMQIVPTIDPIGRQDEVAEAANKTGVEVEALDVITIIIMEAEAIISRTITIILTNIRINNKTITMNSIGYN